MVCKRKQMVFRWRTNCKLLPKKQAQSSSIKNWNRRRVDLSISNRRCRISLVRPPGFVHYTIIKLTVINLFNSACINLLDYAFRSVLILLTELMSIFNCSYSCDQSQTRAVPKTPMTTTTMQLQPH